MIRLELVESAESPSLEEAFSFHHVKRSIRRFQLMHNLQNRLSQLRDELLELNGQVNSTIGIKAREKLTLRIRSKYDRIASVIKRIQVLREVSQAH